MNNNKQYSKLHYVVVTGIIVKDKKFLIVRRSYDETAFPGKWTVPGGKLEVTDYIDKPKTTSQHWYNVLEELLKREIMEETSLRVKNIRYITNLAFIRPDDIPVVVISLTADYDSQEDGWCKGKVQLCKDLTDYAWVSLKEAKKYDLIEGIYEELEMVEKIVS